MNKAETARHFKGAHEIETEAQAKAQALADATAAELEELAQSMHDITNQMCGVLEQVAQHTKTTRDTAAGAAKTLNATAETLGETARRWQTTADQMRRQLAVQSRTFLGVAALSAVVGSASAGLLLHWWPASTNSLNNQSPPPTQVMIDTDKLASEILVRWQGYQRARIAAESGK